MLRRIHTKQLQTGAIELDADAAHHVRNVLRLTVGTAVELFDDSGVVGSGEIVQLTPVVVVRADAVSHRLGGGPEIIVASAVPKGERADWMIEKLSELGCSRFIPLAAARSVVLPEGRNKRERWGRIALESAKQSRRTGVMQIGELTPVPKAIESAVDGTGMLLSTEPAAAPIATALEKASTRLTLFIGPEGGWNDEELASFKRAGIQEAKLTDTVLRVETAAIAAATVAAVLLQKPAAPLPTSP